MPRREDPDHAHDHNEGHDHGGGHNHEHGTGVLSWLKHTFAHSHDVHEKVDTAMETNERGIWALKLSLAGLGATALFQVVIVFFSGSTALLADTIHNFGDAATSIPLWIAFALQRRAQSPLHLWVWPHRGHRRGHHRWVDLLLGLRRQLRVDPQTHRSAAGHPPRLGRGR